MPESKIGSQLKDMKLQSLSEIQTNRQIIMGKYYTREVKGLNLQKAVDSFYS